MKLIKTSSFELATIARGDPDAEKLAIVIPGRMDTKDYASATSLIERLGVLGFFALAFDPPGTWDSPGSIDLCTTTNYLTAVTELIEHFGSRPTVLLGHSRGGTTAMLAASHPAVRGIVAIMSSYGPPSPPGPEAVRVGYNVEYRDLPPGATPSAEPRRFELPLEYFTDGAKYDPVAALRGCTKPKLLIYGTRDSFTHPDKVQEVYAAIPAPKAVHAVDSEHDYRYNPAVVAEVNEAIARFVRDL